MTGYGLLELDTDRIRQLDDAGAHSDLEENITLLLMKWGRNSAWFSRMLEAFVEEGGDVDENSGKRR